MVESTLPSRPATERPPLCAVSGPLPPQAQPPHLQPPRAFGRAGEDLDFDFGSSDRPALVTALLAACSASADAEPWWQARVGERTAALLSVLRAGQGGEAIEHSLRCEQPGCGERFYVELPYAALALGPPLTQSLGPEVTHCLRALPPHILLARANVPPLQLRLPTGADLRAWRRTVPDDGVDAQRAMLGALCLSGELRAEDCAAAAAALAQADPLVAFSVTSVCPACGNEADVEVDLEALVLQRLHAHQRQLLRDVHVLASRYGWTEAEVMALSPTRRAHYVELIVEAA